MKQKNINHFSSLTGFSNILIIVIIVVVIGFAAVFFIFSKSTHQKSSQRQGPDNPPVTYNLGVNFDDFEFNNKDVSHYNNKLFLENGVFLGGPDAEILPHPMYVLPPGTEILSVVNGVVEDIQYQKMHNDYSLVINPDNSSWTIDHDHVTNIKVEKGDRVVAGQVIAEVALATGGLRKSNLGFTEVMIVKLGGSHDGNPTACLYNLLDDSVKEKYHKRIYKLVADWEEFKKDESIYDEESWESPGCIFNEIIEGVEK